MRSSITICFILLVLAPVFLSAGEGVDVCLSVQAVHIQDTIASRLANKAQWVLVAEDVASGKTLVDVRNTSDRSLVPGSLVKLFVTGAVLERNSKEPFDLATVIATDGKISKGKIHGVLVVKGVGNAFLSTPDLRIVVEKLKAQGITEITGDIIVDDSLFDVKAWKNTFEGAAYGRPSALGLDLHTVSITADAASKNVVVDPLNDNVKVSFNPSGDPGVRQIDDLTYEIMGWRPDASMVRKRFSLTDPALYVGGTFLTLLGKQGIKISGIVKRGVPPSPQPSPSGGEGDKRFVEISRIGSKDINAYIRDTNQQSLNVAADNLLFLLGARVYGAPGTREKGIQAVSDFLRELGVPSDGLVVDDGSGVSERNRVPVKLMVAFLRSVTGKPWFDTFYDSLSRPGTDGRLKDLGYRSERVRAKSGGLSNAYCLAGYVDQKDGKRLAFAYMVNGPDANTPAASNAVIEVLKQLEQ